MGEMLLQAYVSEESGNSEAQEKDGVKCEFDNYLEGMRLRTISFITISTLSPLEKSRHRFIGEAEAVSRAIVKLRKYLWGSEFTAL